jgi:hypothetical protein
LPIIFIAIFIEVIIAFRQAIFQHFRHHEQIRHARFAADFRHYAVAYRPPLLSAIPIAACRLRLMPATLSMLLALPPIAADCVSPCCPYCPLTAIFRLPAISPSPLMPLQCPPKAPCREACRRQKCAVRVKVHFLATLSPTRQLAFAFAEMLRYGFIF